MVTKMTKLAGHDIHMFFEVSLILAIQVTLKVRFLMENYPRNNPLDPRSYLYLPLSFLPVLPIFLKIVPPLNKGFLHFNNYLDI